MSNEIKGKDKIRILLTYIFEDGISKYKDNFDKLISRLNELYDTNKVDIINYFTKVVMYLPNQTPIYSNALHIYSKSDITNEILKKLVEELNKTKNCFVFFRTFIFIFGLIYYGIIPNQYLIDFIEEVIAKKNINLLKIIIISIFLIYRRDNIYKFLEQVINLIQKSGIISQDNIIFKTLYNYSSSMDEDMQNAQGKFNGFYIDEIKSEIKKEGDNTAIINIFPEILKIDFDKIICPELKCREISDKVISFNEVYYELLIMNNIEAFKDEPFKGSNNYLFSMPDLYYNITSKENNNNVNPYQFIIDNFTYASVDLILLPVLSQSDLSLIIYFILYVLKERKAHFKILTEDNKEENIYISFIISIISNEKFLSILSPLQINNLITFLCQLITNIPYAKKEIITAVGKYNPNNNSNNTLLYFANSFYEKISNIVHKDSIPEDVYFPEKNQAPNKIDSLTNLSYYKELYTNINSKKPFEMFNKSLFDNDNQNEVFYTFIYCLFNSRNSSLKTIHDLIETYAQAIRDIIGAPSPDSNNMETTENNSDSNDKQKIILKAIFDVYGHSPLHFIYIIDLFAYQNILNHIIIINFIFTEKLFQKKENGLIYSYYELINNSIENCYTMLNKYDDNFQNLAKGFSKGDENKRKEIQQKMDFYDNEVSKLKKQKDGICDEALAQFIKLHEISEGLGGQDYKLFIQKIILDEMMLFNNKYKISEEMMDKAKKLFK